MRKILRRILAAVLIAAIAAPCFAAVPVIAQAADEPTPVRQEVNFNSGWRFWRGGSEDNTPGTDINYDDSGSNWYRVSLPHSIEYVTYDNIVDYNNIAWYRKTFNLPISAKGKEIFVNFGAAMQHATVFINGALVNGQTPHDGGLTQNGNGVHTGGNMDFMFDLTNSNLNYGEGTTNIIAVKLDTRYSPNWSPGAPNRDFRYFGGLYRSSKLIVTDKVHVTDPIFANKVGSGGVFVRANPTSATDKTLGISNIKYTSNENGIPTEFTGDVSFWIGTHIKNDSDAAKTVTVENQIIAKDGTVVFDATLQSRSIAAGGDYQFTVTSNLLGAKLWHPYSPNLYTVKAIVKTGDVVVDEFVTRTGFRTVVFRDYADVASPKVTINGQPFEGLGTNTHQEIGMVGFAVPEDAIRDEVRMVKDAGFDYIRASHYPYQEAFYEACDEYGVMVQAPVTGWQYFPGISLASYTPFCNNFRQESLDLIRRGRNHPAIVTWELFPNESSLPIAPTVVAEAKAEFPTYQMLTTGNTDDYDVRYSSSTVKPYFTYEFGDWQYGGYAATTRMPRWVSSERKLRQAVANYQNSLDNALNSRANYAFYWVWQDYSGFGVTNPDLATSPGGSAPESGNAPTACGLVDFYRIPKYAYYYAQSQRDPKVTFNSVTGVHQGPMVYIATRRFDTDTTNNIANDVPVYSNCEQVELQDGNGNVIAARRNPDTMLPPSGGRNGYTPNTAVRATKHPPFTFTGISLTEYPTVTAVGYIGGVEKARYTVKTPTTAASLKIRWQSGNNVRPLVADGGDKRLIYIDLLDSNGEIKTDSGIVNAALDFGAPTKNATKVTVKVTSGNALILGGDTNDRPGSRGYNSVTITPRGGQVSVWLVAGRTAGDKITVQATAEGITTSNVLEIGTVAPVTLAGADDLSYLDEPYPNPSDDCIATGGLANVSSGHAARANDGNDGTVWTSDTGNAGEYWQVDLINRYNLYKIELLWALPSAYKYQILYSDDGEIWKNLIDKTANSATEAGALFEFSPSAAKTGRFLKILFTSGNAIPFSVAEVHVSGVSAPAAGDVNIARGDAWWQDNAMGATDAGYGCNGDPNTYATASNTGAGNKWIMDLGGHCEFSSINIMWEREYAYPYKIEISNDSKTWFTIINKTNNTNALTITTDVLPSTVTARYVRMTSGKGEYPISFSLFNVYGKGAKDLIVGKTLTTDSAVLNGYATFYANDDDDATYWKPDEAGRYLGTDLGSLYCITGAKVVWADAQKHSYTLLASGDGVNWYRIYEGSSNDQTVINDLFMQNMRYVKLINEGVNGIATFELYGEIIGDLDATGQNNMLVNPSFAAERTDQSGANANDPTGWRKVSGVNRAAGYVEQPASGNALGSDGRRAIFTGTSDFSASLYQTVKGLPNGVYTFSGWIKRGPEAGPEPEELYAYAENYGGETISENLLNAAKYPSQANVPGSSWQSFSISDIHVTNGQVTVGFYANAYAGNFLVIDELSLVLTDADPEVPLYDASDEIISSLNIIKSGEMLTAGYVIRNISTDDINVLHILAAYDEAGRLVESVVKTSVAAAGAISRGSVELTGYNAKYTYKTFIWDAVTFIPICGDVKFSVLGIYDTVIGLNVGSSISLPEKVKVWYKKDITATEDVPVVWDDYDAGLLKKIGSFVVFGTVDGTDIRAKASITIKGVNLVQNPDLEAATGWTFTSPMARSSSAYNTHGPNPGYINYSQSGTGTLTGRATQTYVNTLSGKYKLSCWVEGVTNTENGIVEMYVSINGEEYAVAPITVTVWAEWWYFAIPDIIVPEGATVLIGVRASKNQGSYYHFDDFEFIQTE